VFLGDACAALPVAYAPLRPRIQLEQIASTP
jgi:hypothetical protein